MDIIKLTAPCPIIPNRARTITIGGNAIKISHTIKIILSKTPSNQALTVPTMVLIKASISKVGNAMLNEYLAP